MNRKIGKKYVNFRKIIEKTKNVYYTRNAGLKNLSEEIQYGK